MEPTKIVLQLSDLCPCRSGRVLAKCCAQPDGRVWKAPADLTAPGAPTGFGHTGCYLGFTENCSRRLSAEHFVSRSVLEVFGEDGSINISGLPWLKGETRRIGIKNLTGRVLCERHNTTLSPLDAEAGRFFRTLIDLAREFSSDAFQQPPRLDLFSGEMIEQWAMKTLFGLFFSGNAARLGNQILSTHTLDDDLIANAFFKNVWPAGSGFFFRGGVGHLFQVQQNFGVTTFSSLDGNRVLGLGLIMAGLEFIAILDTDGPDHAAIVAAGYHRRPSQLTFHRGGRMRSIALTWSADTPPVAIDMTWEEVAGQ